MSLRAIVYESTGIGKIGLSGATQVFLSGGTMLPGILLLSFQTNRDSSKVFNPLIESPSADSFFIWDLDEGELYTGKTVNYTYSDATTKTVKLYSTVEVDITRIFCYDDAIIGNIDLSINSAWNSCSSFHFSGNPALTGFVPPSAHSVAVTLFIFSLTDISTIDLGWMNSMSNTNFQAIDCPNLTDVIFGDQSGNFIAVYIYRNDIGIFDLDDVSDDSFFNVDNVYLQIQMNNMSVIEINKLLVDLDRVTSTGYTNRKIYTYNSDTGNSNAVPDSSSGGYNGLLAKSNLEAKDYLVVVA